MENNKWEKKWNSIIGNEEVVFSYILARNFRFEILLDLLPERGTFFEKQDVSFTLEIKKISDEEYMKAKFLFKNLRMRNLSVFNDLYNYQDICILIEIFEIY